jgi:hypothetical protein
MTCAQRGSARLPARHKEASSWRSYTVKTTECVAATRRAFAGHRIDTKEGPRTFWESPPCFTATTAADQAIGTLRSGGRVEEEGVASPASWLSLHPPCRSRLPRRNLEEKDRARSSGAR